jgi:hypothetical protein
MPKRQPRIYVYKITFEEIMHYYYGLHKEARYDEYYMGSPITHKWMWDFYTPKKQILQFFPHTDEGYYEAEEIEKRLIFPVYNTDPYCLNESCGGRISLKIAREVGLRHKENGTGIFSLTHEEKVEIGKKTMEKQRETKTGFFKFTPEERRKIARECGLKTGKDNYEKGLGIGGMTLEERRVANKKAMETQKENGVGFWGMSYEKRKRNADLTVKRNRERGVGIEFMTYEERSINAKKVVEKHKKNGTGIFGISKEKRKEMTDKTIETHKRLKIGLYGLTPEQKSENTKRQKSRRFKCLITGKVNTDSALTRFQNKHNIDKRLRVEVDPITLEEINLIENNKGKWFISNEEKESLINQQLSQEYGVPVI